MNNLFETTSRIIFLNTKNRNPGKLKSLVVREKPTRFLLIAIELFRAIDGKSIVEIGCMRKPLTHPIAEVHRCCTDGHSTYLWCTTGAQVTSVDISQEAVEVARKSCEKFDNCTVIQDDALNFLKQFPGPIDLLYLDGWDIVKNSPYAENHLLAYELAKPKLSPVNIIAIDDTDINHGGKGRLLVPALKADGYQILVQGRQTIAIKVENEWGL